MIQHRNLVSRRVDRFLEQLAESRVGIDDVLMRVRFARRCLIEDLGAIEQVFDVESSDAHDEIPAN